MNERFRRLLSPLDLGPFQVANRVVMGAMHTRLEAVERKSAFPATRVRGEVGLILTGGYSPNEDGWMAPAPGTHHRGGLAPACWIRHAKVCTCSPVDPPSTRSSGEIRYITSESLDNCRRRTVDDFARTAKPAEVAGYDGVDLRCPPVKDAVSIPVIASNRIN